MDDLLAWRVENKLLKVVYFGLILTLRVIIDHLRA
jgi:hypothetical protein